VLESDAKSASTHDFGRDILPSTFHGLKISAYDFRRNKLPGIEPGEVNDYWRDVGTIASYWEANLDLRSVTPKFDIYNKYWPICAGRIPASAAKFVHNEEGRRGHALNSVISEGCIISGSSVVDPVLGPFVHFTAIRRYTNRSSWRTLRSGVAHEYKMRSSTNMW